MNRRLFQETFVSLRHRNYALFFSGQLVSNTGNWLTRVAMVLFVLKLTGSGLKVGLLSACEFGPVFFFSAWAGSLADRFDKRRLLLLTQSLEMLQSFALAALAFMDHPPLIALYVIAVVGGVLLAFDNPVRRSFVGEMVPREDIANAVVLYSIIVNLSRTFGPALAGLMVSTVGYGWAFVLDGVSYLVVLLCLVAMRPADLFMNPEAKKSDKKSVADGMRYVAGDRLLWVNFALLAAIGVMAYNFSVTMSLFATRALAGGEEAFTTIFTIYSFGSVVGALAVARRPLVQMRQVTSGALLFGLSLIFLAVTPVLWAAAVASFAVGFTNIIYLTATTALVQLEARADMQGRVLALQTVILGGSKFLGGPFMGYLADAYDSRLPLWLGGVVCLTAGVFGWMGTRGEAPSEEA